MTPDAPPAVTGHATVRARLGTHAWLLAWQADDGDAPRTTRVPGASDSPEDA